MPRLKLGVVIEAGSAVRPDGRDDPDEARRRLDERDAREAADTRAEAQRWLGDPPAERSGLTKSSPASL